jgi:aminopeptidase N
LSQFNLDLAGLDVAGVQVDGEDAPFTRSGGELVIDPAANLIIGDTFTTVIQVSGVPTATPETGGWGRDSNGGVLAMGEPQGPSFWFPVNDHPSDKAMYTITVTAPSELTVVSNGTMTDKVVDGTTTTWTYADTHPRTSYLTMLAIGDYKVVDGGTSSSGVPIRNVFPTDRVDELTVTFAQQPQMIDAYEEWFGPYPFDVYGALVADGVEVSLQFEAQTLSVFSSHVLDDVAAGGNHAIQFILAHQWFGDSVSLEQWKDIWLNESISSYAVDLWAESQQPDLDLTTLLRDDLAGTSAEQAALFNQPITDVGNELPGGFWISSLFHRGPLMLHALRLEIGDDDFRTLLHKWVADHRDANANTEDFISLAEKVSGKDLADLFDRWLNSPTMPDDFGSVPTAS